MTDFGSSLVGQRLGAYEIQALLGKGGMGEVYRARDPRLGRDVAIKVLPRAMIADPDRLARFAREARAVAALNHPNICTLYDVGPDYLVMEYVDGRPLAGPMPAQRAVEHARQILDALDTAHRQGIIHRDLKPANLLVTAHGIKLLDFGLAKVSSVGEETIAPTMAATHGDAVLGTPGYMAPEQWAGKPADTRSDIYAFGCVLYEMLTGKRVSPDREPVWPAALDQVLRRCLMDNPDDRWQSVRDLRQHLDDAIATRSRRRMMLTSVAAATVVGLIAAAWWQLRAPAAALTDRDVLVLADFTNSTGDAVFDVTLRQALAIQLEESPFLKVIDDAQVRQDLGLMGRSPEERITNDIARDICIRESEKAMIDGAIAKLGETYVVTLQATNCRTGETLAREQEQASSKEQVLAAVATATKGMRAKLGESLSSIRRLERPPPFMPVTTSSIEAYQSFALGQEQFLRGRWLSAVPFYVRATELDPSFALAFQQLAVSYGNAGESKRAFEYSKNALALIKQASEHERLQIESYYYFRMMNDLMKAADVLQVYTETYPRDTVAHVFRANAYTLLGDFEKAAEHQAEAVRLAPRGMIQRGNLVGNYLNLDRFQEARATADDAIAQGLDLPSTHLNLLTLAYVQGDTTRAEKEMQWFAGKTDEWRSFRIQAIHAAMSGQRRKARELFRRAVGMAKRSNQPQVAGELTDAAMGEPFADCTINSQGTLPCGTDLSAALKAAEAERNERPNDTILNAVRLPLLRSAFELKRDQPARAVELLRSASPYELAYPNVVYLRGLAYLRLRQGREAATEFQKILDHPGANWGTRYSLAFLGLARSAAQMGEWVKASRAYQDFLSRWKDADPDLPLLAEARKEYAALRP